MNRNWILEGREFAGRRGHGEGHHHGHGMFGKFGRMMGGGAGFRATRMLSSDDLQLVILALLEEKPRHGYDIIKELEIRSSGIYTPSPGVIYPALTYLEEANFAVSEANGNKKLFQITEAGSKNLKENRAIVDEILEGLTRFGAKMSRVQKQFADEEAENERDSFEPRSGSRAEWRQLKSEFRDLKDQLKAAIFEKIDASTEEKRRVLQVLKKALEEIKMEKKDG
jgi:DNA-binding PadR family transcriptional regulator